MMMRVDRSSRTSPVRMGVLNILVMVIALSLAVLTVLALATAQAGRALSERESDNVQATYACEVSGQQLLAAVDGTAVLLDEADADAELLLRTMEAAVPTFAEAAESGALAAEYGMAASVETLTAAQATELLGERIEALAPTAICAVHGRLTTADRQSLDCIIAVNADRSCTVLAWQQSKLWDDIPTEHLLRTDR